MENATFGEEICSFKQQIQNNTSVYQRKSFQAWKSRVFFKLDLRYWLHDSENHVLCLTLLTSSRKLKFETISLLGVTSIKMKFVSFWDLSQINQNYSLTFCNESLSLQNFLPQLQWRFWNQKLEKHTYIC